MKVKKALIPAAGLGTRMLPATKSQPKEMLPIVDKPVIQYVVEDAVNSGITDVLIVIGKGKDAIQHHFDENFENQYYYKQKGKLKELEELQKVSRLANVQFVQQTELNGLGDAICYGRDFIRNEPFAVLLGDTILEPKSIKPVLAQLLDIFDDYGSSVIALEEVPMESVRRYGIMDGKAIDNGSLYEVTEWVEKPSQENAPSNLAIAGRYVFTPEIFDCLEKTPLGVNNEIQLTDAMRILLDYQKMYGLKFAGSRYDIGNKLDFIKTNLIFGLRNKEMSNSLKEWLKRDIKI